MISSYDRTLQAFSALTSEQKARLYIGPNVDGLPTCFTRAMDVPKGWEFRRHDGGVWVEPYSEVDEGSSVRTYSPRWVQTRPPQQPVYDNPEGYIEISSDKTYVLTWGQMKDRPDLDQWEWMTASGTWDVIGGARWSSDNWPMRVRRKRLADR